MRITIPARAVNRRAGDESISACTCNLRDVIHFYAAINLKKNLPTTFVYTLAYGPEFCQRFGDKLLAAETGIHRHDQHQVQLIQYMVQVTQGGSGIEHQARLASLLLDQPNRAIDMP